MQKGYWTPWMSIDRLFGGADIGGMEWNGLANALVFPSTTPTEVMQVICQTANQVNQHTRSKSNLAHDIGNVHRANMVGPDWGTELCGVMNIPVPEQRQSTEQGWGSYTCFAPISIGKNKKDTRIPPPLHTVLVTLNSFDTTFDGLPWHINYTCQLYVVAKYADEPWFQFFRSIEEEVTALCGEHHAQLHM